MRNKILFSLALVVIALAVLVIFRQPKTFAAHKRSDKIILHNVSEAHYPSISVKCTVNKKTYRSAYKFVPSKGSVELKPTDFSNDKGDTLENLEIVNNLEVTGGDSLINETIDEEVDIK